MISKNSHWMPRKNCLAIAFFSKVLFAAAKNQRQQEQSRRDKKISVMSTDSDFDGVVLNTVTTMVPDTQENEDDLDIIYSNERKHFSTKVG